LEQNSGGRSPFLFTCDHYGRLIPAMLGDLGVSGVAERLSAALDAHLVAQRYSRLVIDCNRPPDAASSIPLISEATLVPGNEGLSREAAQSRRELIFDPYHQRIDAAIDERLRAGRPTVLVSLHSFTPSYAGIRRSWHIGTLYHRDTVLPPLVLQGLRAEPDLVVGDNEPYAVTDDTDYTIPVHGERRGLINSGIEIRQDLISDAAGETAWAERLTRVFSEIEVTLKQRGVI
jgi:predicted N-formylglutamate amidohydrolase